MNKIALIYLLLLIVSCGTNQETRSLYKDTLPGIDNAELSLKSISANAFNLFIAFDNKCPLCKANIPTINKIKTKYPDLGIVLFYPANPKDTIINKYIASLLPKDVLQVKDKNKKFTNYFGAKVTPQAFVVNDKQEILYQGAIDNSMFMDFRKNNNAIIPYLWNALDTIIQQNKALQINENKAIGCYIE